MPVNRTWLIPCIFIFWLDGLHSAHFTSYGFFIQRHTDKKGSTILASLKPDVSAVFINNDRPRYCQPLACSFSNFLCGEKRLKNFTLNFFWNPLAGIVNWYFYIVIIFTGLNANYAFFVIFLCVTNGMGGKAVMVISEGGEVSVEEIFE